MEKLQEKEKDEIEKFNQIMQKKKSSPQPNKKGV